MSSKLKITAIIGMFMLISCSRNIPDPVSPPANNAVPVTPSNLTAAISDRLVYLTWSVSDTQGIKFYRLYISDSTSNNYVLHAEVTQTSLTVNNLRNGRTYYFKVSAVDWSRFEGYSSAPVTAIPNLYGLIINSGNLYTNSRDVSLGMVAPAGTQYMTVSNDSLFIGVTWENYSALKPWLLTSGDRAKTVYVKYRSQNDQTTTQYYSANITLDTQAEIDSIVFTPINQTYTTGDIIHFKLFAGEPNGTASVTIGQAIVSMELFDDGTRGDGVADDGIYETDFTISNNLDFANAVVKGDFIDRANNTAQTVQARSLITVRRAPDPVSIFGIIPPTGYFDRMEIDWNASQAGDFAQYRLYRSSTANVDSSDYLVKSINVSTLTSYVDTGLTPNTTYYYKIFVVDNSGLWAGSNEVHAVTNQNLPPDPVVIYPVVAPPGSFDRLSLSWSASHDQDFLRYDLYRSYDNVVNTSDILILSSSTQTSATDTSLEADSVYFYRIQALDRAGNTSWSNTISGRTGRNLPPEPATIYPLELQPDYYRDIRVQWTQPHTADFQDYHVYSWRNDNGRADSVLKAIIPFQDSIAILDNASFDVGSDTVNYWYIVSTNDLGGNHTMSNAIRVHLVDATPGLVSGAVILDTTSLSVYWDATHIPDFATYRLMRDTLAVPDQSQLVYISTNENTSTYNDHAIVRGHTYYYWLNIYDLRGHSSRSFLGSARW
jgi:fibronectin type 3 domain-containing protein